MERIVRSPDRISIEFDLVAARRQQREYEDMGETGLAFAWERRVDELLGQWAALSGSSTA